MREILFRGKRIDDDEWVDGNLFVPDLLDRPTQICVGTDVIRITHNVDPDTVGQYTGLTDKNGKKIFEGDICRVCLDPEICVGVVEYDERTASFIVKVGKTEMLTFLDYIIAHKKVGDAVWFEVIGNIHDNPELLEGEENAAD